jgi:hypothetical protein
VSSFLIPGIVGLVVVALIVGAIIFSEGRRPASNTASASVNTAQPLATQTIPYPNVPRISLKDTQSELENGQAVLIDVRSKSSYDQAHAAGALSIPEEEIDARLQDLPRDKDVILYCT